jgi:hypothetical protein
VENNKWQMINRKLANCKYLIFSLLCTLYLSAIRYALCANSVLAQTSLKSDNYVIHLPNFNSGAGVPSSSNYKTNVTIGQTAAGLFSSANYLVRGGFQYIHTIIPFSFSISNISISFDPFIAQVSQTRTTSLTVKAGGAGGYSVTAQQNHRLQIGDSGNFIDNTTCDNGNCTRTQAEEWTQDTTYGFGYNIWGDDIPAGFSTQDYYKQFADASLTQDPVTVMSKTAVTWDYPNNTWPWESIATMTFKINVNATQPAGTYNNIIMFVATPTF